MIIEQSPSVGGAEVEIRAALDARRSAIKLTAPSLDATVGKIDGAAGKLRWRHQRMSIAAMRVIKL